MFYYYRMHVVLLAHIYSMAAVAHKNIFRSKFKGCLLGALFGDAFGAEFECKYFQEPVPSEEFDRFSNEKLREMKTNKLFHFTDDSAMTMAICRSLLRKKAFDIDHLANEFVRSFMAEPRRGYGGGVITVFDKLRSQTLEDVKAPARDQFNGTGSYGNGAAMRVAPFALFYQNDVKEVKKAAREQALITHAHTLGVEGAVLQAVAVYLSLHTPLGKLDTSAYIDKLISVAKDLENKSKNDDDICHVDDEEATQSFTTQLRHVKQLLVEHEDDSNRQRVIDTLGHGIRAAEAVPTAIYAFLHKSKTCMKDALFYSMSLGGDTDTIASMTGAIAGAYWGDEHIPQLWLDVTEGAQEMCEYSDEIYNIAFEANHPQNVVDK